MEIRVTGHNFESWPPKDHSSHVCFKLTYWFQRRRLWNVHWMVIYKICVFGADRKSNMTARAYDVFWLVEILKYILFIYINYFSLYELIYGALSMLLLFMLWVYFSWVLVLFIDKLPKIEQFSVSWETSAVKHSFSISMTVKHTPFTAMLSRRR
jgi:hypothetical protein